MKNQKGITLVALVITIIVLLILAGVSISLVVGNNGVLTRASNAVETNREAEVKQDVKMAAASCYTDYMAAWASNSSVKWYSYFTKAAMDGYLPNGTVTLNTTIGDTEPDELSFTYTSNTSTTDGITGLDFTVDSNGTVDI